MRITFRVDEQLLRRTRLRAKAMGTTVNDLVREHITKLASGEKEPYPTPPKLPFADRAAGSSQEGL